MRRGSQMLNFELVKMNTLGYDAIQLFEFTYTNPDNRSKNAVRYWHAVRKDEANKRFEFLWTNDPDYIITKSYAEWLKQHNFILKTDTDWVKKLIKL